MTASVCDFPGTRLHAESQPVTPTNAPDVDLPTPEELPPSPDRPDTPVVEDDDGDPEV